MGIAATERKKLLLQGDLADFDDVSGLQGVEVQSAGQVRSVEANLVQSRGHHAVGKRGDQFAAQVVNRELDVSRRRQAELDGGAGVEGVGIGCQLECGRLFGLRLDVDALAVAGTESTDLFTRGVVLRQAVGLVAKPEISTIRIAEQRIHDNGSAEPMVMRPSNVVVDGQIVRVNHFLPGSSVAHEETVLEQSVIASPVVIHRAPVNGAVAGVVTDEAAIPRSDIGGSVVENRTEGKRTVLGKHAPEKVDLTEAERDIQGSAVVLVTGRVFFFQLIVENAIFTDVGKQLLLEGAVVAHEVAVPHLDEAEAPGADGVGPNVILVAFEVAIFQKNIAAAPRKKSR